MVLYLLYRLAFLSSFMACLTQLRYGIRRTCVIVAAFILVLWGVNFPIYVFKGSDFFNYIWPLTVSVPAFICFCLLSKLKFFQVVFSFITICNFGMLTSYVGFLSLMFSKDIVVRVLFEIISFTILMIFMIKVFRKPYFKVQKTLEKGWGLLSIVPVLLSVILYLLMYYPNEINNRLEDLFLVFLVFVLMFALYTTVYLNFENITHFYQLKHDNDFIKLQIELQKKEYNAIMDKVNGIRIYRHDMRHQINTISAFLHDSNILEAQKYLNSLNDNFSKTVIENYCDNYGVNCILSSYLGRAKEEQIHVDCDVALSENIKIEDIDLGIVFANAIENAINACKKIESPDDRKITVICKEHHSQIYIQICNTYVGAILFDGDYPLSNETEHGIGTRSIAAIAEKHGGVFSFAAKEGSFKSTVILNYR